MQHAESHSYFQKRAVEERAAAASANDDRAAQPHRQLAQMYDAIVEGRADAPGGDDKVREDASAVLPSEFTILP